MSIATNPWNDNNRFSQTGYSAKTLMPLEENYINKMLYIEDIGKAEWRESSHLEFLEELQQEAKEDQDDEKDEE